MRSAGLLAFRAKLTNVYEREVQGRALWLSPMKTISTRPTGSHSMSIYAHTVRKVLLARRPSLRRWSCANRSKRLRSASPNAERSASRRSLRGCDR